MLPRASLYIHVPFCRSKCSYCDFHSVAGAASGAMESWLGALETHRAYLADCYGERRFETVFIGGGTPSSLPGSVLRELLFFVSRLLERGPCAEYTFEANPDDVDEALLRLLDESGVTRLSMGVQSLEDSARTAVGRRGDAGSVLGTLGLVARAWPGDWSVDMMAGLPGQSVEGALGGLESILSLRPRHLSLYELVLEEHTRLGRQVAGGEVALPDEDTLDAIHAGACKLLESAGLRRYEVSNWAVPGHECRHNEVYWELGDWFGLGTGAVSNLRLPGGQLERVSWDAGQSVPVPQIERIVGTDEFFEYCMLGLRTRAGVAWERLEERFGTRLAASLERLAAMHPTLLSRDGEGVRPTSKGMDLLNVPLKDLALILDDTGKE